MLAQLRSGYPKNSQKDALLRTPNWPGEWFVLENDKVSGPFTAKKAFEQRLPDEAELDEVRVTRKGFQSWYRFDELNELYWLAKAYPEDSPQDLKQKIEGLSKEQIEALKLLQRAGHVLGKEGLQKQVKITSPRVAGKQLGPSFSNTAVRNPPLTALRSNETRLKKNSGPSYLKLGEMRDPYFFAFFLLFVTFGLSWFFWMTKTAREIGWHLMNPKLGRVSLLEMLPVFHFIGIYRLAQNVQKVERENNYSTISPLRAALLAVFPPLAIVYIQKALNMHWTLHQRHVQRTV